MEQTKITLDENEMPRQWYNVLSDLSSPIEPPLDPRTWEPVSPEALELIFAKALIKQEMSDERFIDIPKEVHEIYKLWRPSPLYRAHRLEKALKTPAKIYYKYEGVSPAGSHKTNTSIAQAYYNMKEGTERMTTETGAGQWGSALALACNYFELECKVYMVRSSYYQKPYRKSMMTVWGGNVVPSPSPDTEFGRKILEEQPDTPGSLGIAISEAVEDAIAHDNTKYSLGSVLNHVILHQTIIGSECKKQLEKVETYPDIVIGCCGGGSNLAGISLEFIKDRLEGKGNARVIAVEPSACPTLTKGEYRYDYGDTAEMTPLLKMYTLGHKHVPPAIHAGGLRYHGDSPIISKLYAERLIEAVSYDQYPVFDAGVQFARTEGIVPAPESSHAIRCAIDEALKCRKTGEEKTILFNLSGHGHFDMTSYDKYFNKELS
ncbi:MAG: TrpB-like pyridoxal phosphate-dependent enzyme [Methanosarcina thermophila]|jgi:tryptophan synthase beta chain|uniref:Tryptophan synthase beta chain n=3 Tax=Methanosarcina thermophila TaxID=2210 RepID=A0A1I6XSH5_METTE|nr:TrpB-like pyridoxal phosphate-dependent enzyme [Methanosarcina thermophila]ALK05693.1 MAG: tryptophan synthase subunit beta [Methanosarcina sp. 795]AKB12855.1 Tryptophan synthase beta chain 1 [Methanosarcina thermophila TM-1]AKB16524.1 Tryptophan synthase beta chain 1 [Methanosarcina thermophila CHTI-55]NLU56880.1 TrpB-like pyridoxal phosphate-dependent enzyme [Methanosarcina thermophila]SFT41358.1 tryptophan synthase beta chain [Methanosarcina thermophila]